MLVDSLWFEGQTFSATGPSESTFRECRGATWGLAARANDRQWAAGVTKDALHSLSFPPHTSSALTWQLYQRVGCRGGPPYPAWSTGCWDSANRLSTPRLCLATGSSPCAGGGSWWWCMPHLIKWSQAKPSSPPPAQLSLPSGEKYHWGTEQTVQLPCVPHLSGWTGNSPLMMTVQALVMTGMFSGHQRRLHLGHVVKTVALHSLTVEHRATCHRMLFSVWFVFDFAILEFLLQNWQQLFSRFLHLALATFSHQAIRFWVQQPHVCTHPASPISIWAPQPLLWKP